MNVEIFPANSLNESSKACPVCGVTCCTNNEHELFYDCFNRITLDNMDKIAFLEMEIG